MIVLLVLERERLIASMFIWYQFTANAVLEGACERVIVGEQYCDIPLGLYVIRGENVVLIGDLVRLLSTSCWLFNFVVSPVTYLGLKPCVL